MKQIPAESKSPRLISSPAYDWNPDSKLATLREDVVYEATPIHGHYISLKNATLHRDGSLYIISGFVWDLGSGPAVNTPSMVYGSLAHDAFYDMMNADALPWKKRKAVDKYFRYLLKKFGMGFFRRQWVYAGVRYGYPIWRALGLN